MANRTRLDVDQRRAQLLDIGMHLFSTRSYEDVQIEDIAAEASISKGLLYHYFGGKSDFYVAVVRTAADRLVRAVDTESKLEGPARVVQALNGYLDFVDARRGAYLALMQGGLGRDPRIVELIRATRDRIIGDMLGELGLAEPRPVFRAALRGWIGAVEAQCLDWLRHGDVTRDVLIGSMLVTLQAQLQWAVVTDPAAGLTVDDLG
jgi:AcrR family transcriptional regulator